MPYHVISDRCRATNRFSDLISRIFSVLIHWLLSVQINNVTPLAFLLPSSKVHILQGLVANSNLNDIPHLSHLSFMSVAMWADSDCIVCAAKKDAVDRG
jgi:hypothetical protein